MWRQPPRGPRSEATPRQRRVWAVARDSDLAYIGNAEGHPLFRIRKGRRGKQLSRAILKKANPRYTFPVRTRPWEITLAAAPIEVDVTLDELDSPTPASTEQCNQIARDSSIHTVTLFALSASSSGDVLKLAGTGTLIAYKEANYILTASHVWRDVLEKADRLGITLREIYDHRCLMETETIVASGPAMPNAWNEWGPDIVFLRIPTVRVGEIKAFRAFHRLPSEEKSWPKGEHTEARLLVGVPEALGTYKQNHASVQMMHLWVAPPTHHARNGFDYLDVEARLPLPSKVESFGGMSGGGLWKVKIYSDPVTGKIDSEAILDGMAFWARDVKDGSGVVRCHGPESIRSALTV